MLSRERHYSFRQLSMIWHFNYHTVRGWFIDRNGNIEPGCILVGKGKKNKSIRVPESVAQRVYDRHMVKGRAA